LSYEPNYDLQHCFVQYIKNVYDKFKNVHGKMVEIYCCFQKSA